MPRCHKAVVRNFPKELLESGADNVSSWPHIPIGSLKSFNLLFNRKAKNDPLIYISQLAVSLMSKVTFQILLWTHGPT